LEHDLIGKPVPTPHQVRGRLFPDHAHDLTRRCGGLNRPRLRLNRLASQRQIALFRHADSAGQALTARDFAGYIVSPTLKRKEVIQCLVSSAVTSLGSPAEHVS
jgi:hypothetical protein